MHMLDHLIFSIGWTIIHSLWQGALFVFLFVLFTVIFHQYGIRLKYTLGVIVLFLFLLNALFTFTIVFHHKTEKPVFPPQNQQVYNVNSAYVDSFHPRYFEDQQQRGSVQQSYWALLKKLQHLLNKLAYVLAIIWTIGMSWLFVRQLRGYFVLNALRKNKLNIPATKWQAIVQQMSNSINLKRKVCLLLNPLVTSPMVFGFFRPVVFFPLRLISGLSDKEIQSILAHELYHILRNDYLVNVFQSVIEILFFYHPGVWWLSAKIRTLREMICDNMASNFSGHPEEYIHTLVKLEELRLADANLAMAANRNQNKLLARIKWIVTTKGIKQTKVPAIVPLSFAAILMLLLFSFRIGYSTLGNSNGISDLDFFTSVENNLYPYQGAFVLYDVKNEHYYTYNDSLCKTRFNPFSTFKVLSTLIALESGTARDKNFTIKYDSIKFPSKPWMHNAVPQKFWFQDHDLQSALQYSVNWFYLELHQIIGGTEMNYFIHRCNYGNGDISSGLNNFWMGGSLSISAFEQVEFLKKVYSGKLEGFGLNAQKQTKQIMLNESTDQYKLYGKTGTGEVENDNLIGWYIGFLETENNAFVFALNMFVDDYQEVGNNKRQFITKQIFRDLQITH